MKHRLIAATIAITLLAFAHPAFGATHRAAVVVRTATTTKTYCVPFTHDHITGVELLERAGVPVVGDTSAVGTAVCKIGTTGCSSDDCFCRYPVFWGYWTKDRGQKAWHFSDMGAEQRTVVDGAIDGWSFGRNGKPAPKTVDIADICTPQAMSAQHAPVAMGALKERSSGRLPNYLPFVALIAVLVLLAMLAVTRRRRADRAGTDSGRR